jgi:hypothetical protein
LDLDWAKLKNLLEKFLSLMHWKPLAKSSRELLMIQIILVLLLPTVSCKTFRNVAWRASDVPMFQNTVERAARNRQVGIHPVLLIATLIDPSTNKSLFSVLDEESKTAIRDQVLELMK